MSLTMNVDKLREQNNIEYDILLDILETLVGEINILEKRIDELEADNDA